MMDFNKEYQQMSRGLGLLVCLYPLLEYDTGSVASWI